MTFSTNYEMRKLSDEKLEKFFDNKSVVVVGSAPSVLINSGKNIDSFDIVVRINKIKTGFEELIGNRTTILYSYFGKNIRVDLNEHKIDLLMCKYPDADIRGWVDGLIHPGQCEDFQWVYEYRKGYWKYPVWIPSKSRFKKNWNKLGGYIPTTGFCAVLDILQFSPRLVYMTGFDFFETKIHNINEKWNKKRDGGGHHFNKEYEAFKKLFRTDKRLQIDSYLTRKLLKELK